MDEWLKQKAFTYMRLGDDKAKRQILKEVYTHGGKTYLLRFAALTGTNIYNLEQLLYRKEKARKKRTNNKYKTTYILTH